MLLVIDQSLVEVAGTDGQVEDGRVVFEELAVETDLSVSRRRLEKPMQEKLQFLRWVGYGLSHDWTQYSTDIPNTPGPSRGHTSVSDPVSRKGPNREPLQKQCF